MLNVYVLGQKFREITALEIADITEHLLCARAYFSNT